MIIGKTKLKPFLTNISIIAVSAFLMVSTGYAASLTELVSSEGSDNYYGYHSSSSGYTKNNTTQWQALGNSASNGNYGVTWKTNDDTSWGNEDLFVGQTVTFKFEMYSDQQGTHLGNVLKAWFASGSDTTFDDSNVIASGFAEVGDQTAGSSVEYFNEKTILITEDMIGTAYLRARVTCTESIFNSDSSGLDDGIICYKKVWSYWEGWHYEPVEDTQWNHTAEEYEAAFDAYAYYWQGEIEEWAIKINGVSSGGTSPVPEPATFALFGIGLLGLAGISRKKLNNRS